LRSRSPAVAVLPAALLFGFDFRGLAVFIDLKIRPACTYCKFALSAHLALRRRSRR
jgi:hypothetical protein